MPRGMQIIKKIRHVVASVSICFISQLAFGFTDTLLLEVRSRPHFYNVAALANGKILCGTAAGVFEINGIQFKNSSKTPGYVWVYNNGKNWRAAWENVPATEANIWQHLLPQSRQNDYVTHVVHQDLLYLVAQGKLFIYQLTGYKKSFNGHSIRAVSANHVGGYSGVYLNGELQKNISYTNGFIREFDTVTFVCHDGLLMVTATDTINFQSVVNSDFAFLSESFGHVRDIVPIAPNRYILLTLDGLFEVNFSQPSIKRVGDCTDCADAPIYLGRLEDTHFFAMGPHVFRYVTSSGTLNQHFSTQAVIMDGKLVGFDLLLLQEQALVLVDLNKQAKQLAALSAAHTLDMVSDSVFLIGTNRGLFAYNKAQKKLEIVIPEVEFNRRAIYVDATVVKVGSTIGLFSFSPSQLPTLIEQALFNTTSLQLETFGYQWLIIGIILLLVLVVLYISIKYWLKLQRQLSAVPAASISTAEVEQFINDNLTRVNIPLICAHFEVSVNVLYKILSPERPGALIHRARMLKVLELGSNGSSLDEISQKTGFSMSYLQKIKRKIPRLN